MSLSRREFFAKTGVSAAAMTVFASGIATLKANPLGLPIGSQTYPHRVRIACGDFVGLLKDMKAIGIEVIELCDPWHYADFKSLVDGKATRKMLDDNGIKAISAHVGMDSYRTKYADVVKWAHDVGLVQLSTADLGGKTNNGWTTEDEVKRAAAEYSQIGLNSKKEGFQQALHNETFANSRLVDGRLTYPILLQSLDPAVGMQFQMSSMTTVGDPIAYFNLYPGRFVSAHLQGVDPSQGMRASTAGVPAVKSAAAAAPAKAAPTDPCVALRGSASAPGGASARQAAPGRGNLPAAPPQLALGEDRVDWPKIFAAAKTGGMKNFFVEQTWDLTKKSVAYLKTLNVV